MNKQEIFKIMHSNEWKEEEAQLSVYILDLFSTCHLESKNAYPISFHKISIYHNLKHYGFEWVPNKEVREFLDWAWDKYLKDKEYIYGKHKEFLKVYKKTTAFFSNVMNKNLKNLSNDELKKLFLNIESLGKKVYAYTIMPEGMDLLKKEDYLKHLPKSMDKESSEVIGALSTPDDLSFLERERISLLHLVKLAMKKQDFTKALKEHTENYFWIQSTFKGANYLKEDYFLEQINNIIKDKDLKWVSNEIDKLNNKKKFNERIRKEIYKKHSLSRENKLFFEMVRFFTLLQDQRKECILKLIICADQIFIEISKRLKIKKSDLNKYFVEDVVFALEESKFLDSSEIKKRENVVFVNYLEGRNIKTKKFYGKDSDEIVSFFKNKRKEILSSKSIKGFVASTGDKKIVKGNVRVMFAPEKGFRKGEILVTGMTRPEFVPLMNKAAAIITNEGGITTHAAIVSREIGVPCIIGTKVATDLLKSGDLVELDMEKGIVRKLK